MLKQLLLFILFFPLLHAARIDFISPFVLDNEISTERLKQAGFDIHISYNYPYIDGLSAHDADVHKIILMNPCIDIVSLSELPKEKLVLFAWEPMQVPPSYYDFFSRVYTWNDALVDQKTFFKFYYPSYVPLSDPLPPFSSRRLATCVATNWDENRRKMISFFENKPFGEFLFFGKAPPPLCNHILHGGSIAGAHTGGGKISLLKQFRFSICFENTTHLKGYISEKLFSCFAAGTIPIYFGAPNIEDHIPSTCLIDYRKFKTNEDLYQYLKGMSEEEYNRYVSAIRDFLQTEKAHLFSMQHLDDLLYEAATQ